MDLRAVIFVPALAGCAILCFTFAIFAAHNYLTVLQSTGSGARQVVWISEPLVDIFWKVFYLGWLIGLWLGPALLLGRISASGHGIWLSYAVPLLVFWICYPVSQISSLSGPSVWLPLHHEVFGRLARKPTLALGFLVVSAPALALVGLGFYLTFRSTDIVWLFVGSPLFVAAGLLYGRLLGRVAFALMYTRSILSRRKKKPRREESESKAAKVSTTVVEDDAEFVQPSELPPIQTPDEGDLHGYNVSFADEKPGKRRVRAEIVKAESNRPRSDDEEEEASYEVHAPEVEPADRLPADVVKPSEIEMRLLNRDDAPKPPKQVWTAEVFLFLFQPETLTVIAMLTVLCVLAGGMVRVARAFNPAG